MRARLSALVAALSPARCATITTAPPAVSGCLGTVRAGDHLALSFTVAVTPAQTITSP